MIWSACGRLPFSSARSERAKTTWSPALTGRQSTAPIVSVRTPALPYSSPLRSKSAVAVSSNHSKSGSGPSGLASASVMRTSPASGGLTARKASPSRHIPWRLQVALLSRGVPWLVSSPYGASHRTQLAGSSLAAVSSIAGSSAVDCPSDDSV